jgi:hypothetical protein
MDVGIPPGSEAATEAVALASGSGLAVSSALGLAGSFEQAANPRASSKTVTAGASTLLIFIIKRPSFQQASRKNTCHP